MYKNFDKVCNKFNNEVRGCCYVHALRIIKEAKKSKNFYLSEKTIDAIVILLFCWNFAAQITKKLTREKIRRVIIKSMPLLKKVEHCNITNLEKINKKDIIIIFNNFKHIFGQTGASKALNLLNPQFFVMWDTKIRQGMRKQIKGIKNGGSGKEYFIFLEGIQQIIIANHLTNYYKPNEIAKRIDEYNYVTMVKKYK